MKTSQFQALIQAVTNRPLTLKNTDGEIALEQTVTIYRPFKPGETRPAFDWKTPKKEDSLFRSFITAFCSKYLEPDPSTYEDGSWERNYAEKWNDPESHWTCSPWHHHRTHQYSKDKLKSQIIENFSKFDSSMARLGFYETNYGIGIFTLYGGPWVRTSLESMANYLQGQAIPFRNELSDAGWVTRFVIGLDKIAHNRILGTF